MEGKEVYRRAVRAIVESAETAMAAAGLDASDVDLFIPHQANLRIIEARRRPASGSRRTGSSSTSTATATPRPRRCPIALAEAADEGRLRDGDLVLLSGFGAGMSWASAVLRWGPAR